jgi:phospholipase C
MTTRRGSTLPEDRLAFIPYTVEPHKHLVDTWPLAGNGTPAYDFSVYGPNGFYRTFRGGNANHSTNVDVRAIYDINDYLVALQLSNRSRQMAILRIVDAYRSRPIEIVVEPGETENSSWKLKRTSGWYDFTVSAANDSTFLYRAAGHLENGDDSISDPLMGGLV